MTTIGRLQKAPWTLMEGLGAACPLTFHYHLARIDVLRSLILSIGHATSRPRD
jgi:hypothetical protein